MVEYTITILLVSIIQRSNITCTQAGKAAILQAKNGPEDTGYH
jgi:hypothetical protein